jgi:hypothetical protein
VFLACYAVQAVKRRRVDESERRDRQQHSVIWPRGELRQNPPEVHLQVTGEFLNELRCDAVAAALVLGVVDGNATSANVGHSKANT